MIRATLSTALTSNNLNVAVGLLLPATIVGLQPPSGQTTLIAAWYAGLTELVLVWAYRDHSLGRVAGAATIAAYLVFVVLLLATTGVS